jgi:hypothetical protein
METAPWAGSTDFVLFWTNVLDWAGDRHEAYRAHTLEEADARWRPLRSTVRGKPGIYQNAEGAQEAFNMTPISPAPADPGKWKGELAGLLKTGRPSLPLDLPLVIAALLCAAGAALTWQRRRPGRSWVGSEGILEVEGRV